MHECKELPSHGNRARPARPQESRDRWSRADSCHTGSVNGMGCAGEAWKQRRSLQVEATLFLYTTFAIGLQVVATHAYKLVQRQPSSPSHADCELVNRKQN